MKRWEKEDPSTRAPNLKYAHFTKNGHGLRFMAVTNTSAAFNKLSIFAFCFYTLRSFSTYAKFPKTKISYPLLRTRTHGIRNINFSEDITYILNR